jgi:hypothetical protein
MMLAQKERIMRWGGFARLALAGGLAVALWHNACGGANPSRAKLNRHELHDDV